MKRKALGSERDYLIALDEMLQEWIDRDSFKAGMTYKHWQHDKGSLTYGYITALKHVQEKLRDRRDIL